MKLCTGFIANSSSTSFVIMVDNKDPNGAQITIPNIITIALNDYYDLGNDGKNDSSYSHYRYNWRPTTLDECISEVEHYLKKTWIRRLMFNNDTNTLSDIEKYSSRCADNVLLFRSKDDSTYNDDYDSLVKYFANEFHYIANTYDLMHRMISDYWNNFVLSKCELFEKRLESYMRHKKYFKDFYHMVMDVDNKECFSFQQYVCNLSIHNQGIHAVNPISYEGTYVVIDGNKDKEDVDRNAILWYNTVINTTIHIKKLLLAYLYCYFTDHVLQNLIIGSDGNCNSYEVDSIVKDIYQSTRFRRPLVNFDVIDKCDEQE